MPKRTLETTRTPDDRPVVTDTRAQNEKWPGRTLTVDLGTYGIVVGAGDNLEDLSASLSECVQQLLADPPPDTSGLNVRIILANGHTLDVVGVSNDGYDQLIAAVGYADCTWAGITATADVVVVNGRDVVAVVSNSNPIGGDRG